MKKTVKELRLLLNNLSFKKNKVEFLYSIYVPGYKAVVDLLLEFEGYLETKILVSEVDFAIENNTLRNVYKYGKMYIDEGLKYMISAGSIPNRLNEWKQDKLVEYFLSELPRSSSKEEAESAYKSYKALNVCQNVLELHRKKFDNLGLIGVTPDTMIAFQLVNTGAYESAITHLTTGPNIKSYHLADAWRIAKNYLPKKKEEIAKIIWTRGFPKDDIHWVYNFAEVALYLGFKSEIIKILNQEVVRLELEPPRFYEELVKALKLVGAKASIPKVLLRAEEYVSSNKKRVDDCVEMGHLCWVAEKPSLVKKWFAKAIDYRIEKSDSSFSGAESVISQYVKLTGDHSMQKKRILILERQKLYGKAANLASKLGMKKRARGLREIQKMLATK
ncbi:hypothetical protein A2733_01240 [Candidatus Nomurabacteria bacterium RIFCSPHIGHO2_01_FULL_40_20]|uniref:Uncharacterized protein n=1 Tax=Candidatus Nomurabacteria bacterium RIFCSPHIGHO2_01_FULL_40_20 TaxID=1801738 RepID=A0A1F6V410_9BACT|nr:MAG: hypothetical protein A2733_01240 [Candidatus Nomurabacteria bacterium RIFCSPHIGHO2_01_FULL_40_20]